MDLTLPHCVASPHQLIQWAQGSQVSSKNPVQFKTTDVKAISLSLFLNAEWSRQEFTKTNSSKDSGSIHQLASCPSKPKYATDGTQKQADFEPFNVLSILMPSPADSPCPASHTAGMSRVC